MVSIPTPAPTPNRICLSEVGKDENGRKLYCREPAWVIRQYKDDAGNERKEEFHLRVPREDGTEGNTYLCLTHAAQMVPQRVGELEDQVGHLLEKVIPLGSAPDQVTNEQNRDLETIARGFDNAFKVMSEGLESSSQEDYEPMEQQARAFNRAMLLALNAMANAQTVCAKALRDKAVAQIIRLQSPEELTAAAQGFNKKLFELSSLWATRNYTAVHNSTRELLDAAHNLLAQVGTYEERERDERVKEARVAAELRTVVEVQERIRQNRAQSSSPLARFRAARAAQTKALGSDGKTDSSWTSAGSVPSPKDDLA